LAGFIYVMTNAAFPNLVKIGKSSKDPTKYRAIELQSTGVPAPFKVEYYALVEDENVLEQKVHRYFSTKRFSDNREFFGISTDDAVNVIKLLASQQNTLLHEKSNFISVNPAKQLNQKPNLADVDNEIYRDPKIMDALDIKIAQARQSLINQNSMQLNNNGITLRQDTSSDALITSALITAIGLIVLSAFMILNVGYDARGITISILISALLSICLVFPLSLWACWPQKTN